MRKGRHHDTGSPLDAVISMARPYFHVGRNPVNRRLQDVKEGMIDPQFKANYSKRMQLQAAKRIDKTNKRKVTLPKVEFMRES